MTRTGTPLELLEQERFTPEVGMFVAPDQWPFGSNLVEADDIDKNVLGASFRINTSQTIIPTLPVNIEVTGTVAHREGPILKTRVQVTFCNDGEPNTTTGTWMWLKDQS